MISFNIQQPYWMILLKHHQYAKEQQHFIQAKINRYQQSHAEICALKHIGTNLKIYTHTTNMHIYKDAQRGREQYRWRRYFRFPNSGGIFPVRRFS